LIRLARVISCGIRHCDTLADGDASQVRSGSGDGESGGASVVGIAIDQTGNVPTLLAASRLLFAPPATSEPTPARAAD
jgi:hypothetical protein